MENLTISEETVPTECIVCTSVSAEKIYRRDRNPARRLFLFLINIFMDD